MEFKIAPIEVPKDDPFRFDALDRKGPIEGDLTNLIDALKGPFVLAINSPWGTGKTTFVRMWKAFLESRGFSCLYFNAWEADFSADPLVAFLGELEALQKRAGGENETFRDHFSTAKRIATVIAKRAAPVAAKIATAGILDLNSFTEAAIADFVKDAVKDAVDAYTAEKKLIIQFRVSLTKAVASLKEADKKGKLIVFVDDIDRCRPTFAIELLERVKHIFDMDNVIFVLSIDKGQLAVSLKAIYGAGLNADAYLRRFLDLEYSLPPPDPKAFTNNLFNRFGFDAFFAERTHTALEHEPRHLVETFTTLSDLLKLDLRAREQCFTRLRVAMLTTPPNEHFFPMLVTTLVILSAGAPEVYRQYAVENGSATEVLKYLSSLKGGEEFLGEHFGTVMEAYLLAADTTGIRGNSQEIERYRAVVNNQDADPAERERATTIVRLVDRMSFPGEPKPSRKNIVRKIELTAQFKE